MFQSPTNVVIASFVIFLLLVGACSKVSVPSVDDVQTWVETRSK